jgi:hypothetical protein
MVNNRDWLPTSRAEQLNMAKAWLLIMTNKAALWNIPQTVLNEFQPLITATETIFGQLISPDRTSVITAEANRIFGAMISDMRFIKDRFLKNLPSLKRILYRFC